ncbi:MAG: hypothetical protein AB1348_09570, partial [Nitrospirota bacterium]
MDRNSKKLEKRNSNSQRKTRLCINQRNQIVKCVDLTLRPSLLGIGNPLRAGLIEGVYFICLTAFFIGD